MGTLNARLMSGQHGLAVGGWFGASVVTALVVAPAAFETLPTRAAAGSFVGHVLVAVHLWGAYAALVALGTVAVRPGRLRKARWTMAGIICAVAAASIVLHWRIAVMRAALGPIDALAESDPGRRAFGVLHGLSMVVMLIGMFAAVFSLLFEAAAEGITPD